MFFTMANIALPGTSSFVGEFLILSGCFPSKYNSMCSIAATGMILGGWLLLMVI